MTTDAHLEVARRASDARFDRLRTFVRQSSQAAPGGDLSYRSSLYASWILLLYAATEAALTAQTEACLRFLGGVVPKPDDLPKGLLREHRRRTLQYLASLAADPGQEFHAQMRSVDDRTWFEHSRMLRIEGNVWPDSLKEWFNRLELSADDASWLSRPRGEDAETIGSKLAALVRQRNAIAHGEVPTTLETPDLVETRVTDMQFLTNQFAATMQRHLPTSFPIDLPSIGSRDPNVRLGKSTAAIKVMRTDLVQGGHVLLVGLDSVRVARVQSLWCGGATTTSVAAGEREVAVGLSKGVGDSDLFASI